MEELYFRIEELEQYLHWNRRNLFYKKSRTTKLAYILNSISSTDVDKFGKLEMTKKILFSKNAWYDWLTNYILEPIKNSGIALRKKLGQKNK